jgi:hypothetical protein
MVTPGYSFSIKHLDSPPFGGVGGGFPWVHSYADRRFLLERLQIAFEAFLAHQLACFFRESGR